MSPAFSRHNDVTFWVSSIKTRITKRTKENPGLGVQYSYYYIRTIDPAWSMHSVLHRTMLCRLINGSQMHHNALAHNLHPLVSPHSKNIAQYHTSCN